METVYIIKKNSLTARVSGRIDTYTSHELDKMLSAILSSGEITKLHFEFGKLDYISSSGLRVLLAALKKIDKAGGTAYIENANDVVKSIFEMTGFNTLFELISAPNDTGEGDSE